MPCGAGNELKSLNVQAEENSSESSVCSCHLVLWVESGRMLSIKEFMQSRGAAHSSGWDPKAEELVGSSQSPSLNKPWRHMTGRSTVMGICTPVKGPCLPAAFCLPSVCDGTYVRRTIFTAGYNPFSLGENASARKMA